MSAVHYAVTPPGPIRFGTDGWRGVIAADFTFDRLYRAAGAAAQVLADTYGNNGSRRVFVGYDRRFLSEEFATVTAQAVHSVGLEAQLATDYATTPALSWAVHEQSALGALVITASHNPGQYSGLKIKGAFGGSVPGSVTAQVEALLDQGFTPPLPDPAAAIARFDPWQSYRHMLRQKVDLAAIQAAIRSGQLSVFVDVMHGAAARALGEILEVPVTEFRSDRDPLFGGGAPEPLAANVVGLCQQLSRGVATPLAVGFVFDGDGDRIAAVDRSGEFLSSQVLIPILIEHLAARRGYPGELVKTVSGSDLMPKVAALFDIPVAELPVGYKYIADRMQSQTVLLGGEESGGIGYGSHIPERDGLLSALYLLEAIVQSGRNLGELYADLQARTQFQSAYDRIDLPLADMQARDRVLQALQNQAPTAIAGLEVVSCQTIDGFKFRLSDNRWLMVRFSGTEPLLRLYCEAATPAAVQATLHWARDWAQQI
ncbi:phosphoglucomutase/phosphomannomutase family protein [Synechococcus elongatus]|uniref:Phosphoglucomutase/phosphomannomutase family protein n=1 Tax=Synechococcus elongatus PCC 11801 TaxID=2219813 RepID=A0AAN1UUC6_SYNEL|nr:phosphoglucomutase/phosphomannomutase family protein [Synechococcus elongatus]AZB72422.1 phosphoglucomutase/phosphomannomutase family protein [Synechococcus elongatus PCC 11801]